MLARHPRAIVVAALVCGAAGVAVALTGYDQDLRLLWAIFGPAAGLSFVGTGLYAARRRPESRTGELMVLFGFAWFVSVLGLSDSALLFTVSLVAGGLWGGVFLQLVMAFPSGRLERGWDRRLVVAGYVIFTVATVPAMLVTGPEELGCDGCPANLLLVHRDDGLSSLALGLLAAAYAVLFVIVLVRLALRWRHTPPLERLQLTPVYASGLLTFLLATTAQAGAGDAARWAALIVTALLPFAFLGGLLRSHVARLDAELRASRLRIVEAGDTERRRLERNLHDGAQARLVGLAMLLGHARRSSAADPAAVPELLDRALGELRTSLAELRELARGIHPAVLTEKGLVAAVYALASRAPVPVTIDTDGTAGQRLPEPVEAAAYFVVSEAIANVAKYAGASEATVALRREGGRLTVDVADDGVGGADAARGSGLRGLADRIAALDGTLSVDSPPGRGTRVHVEIPCDGYAVGTESS